MSNDFVVGASEEIARLSLGQGQKPNRMDPPSVSIPGSVVTVDITNKFIQAAKSLAPGDLVKDELFTLFESVGALEIMDPKMDSGYLKPGDDFEETYDVSKPLLPEEVLGIIDQLLCFEMSWHLGYPLSQTLLSSVYVEALSMPDPANVEDAKFVRSGNVEQNAQPMLQVLRAYCLGMLKEEDFVTNTYNRSLLSSVATQGIRNAIVEAQDLLENLRGTIDDGVIEALDVRLQLRSTLLSAAECPQHVRDPDAARRPWKEGLLLLPRIEASHKLGRPVEEAFSAKLQRKLASTIPPRPIVHIKFEEAFEHLTRLFRDGLEVIDVLDWTDSQCLQTFVSMFQSKQPQPLVFVRTLLQTFMFSDMQILGKMSIRRLIDDDLSIITLPASPYLDRANDEIEVTTDPRFALAQQMELFRQRAAQPFLDTLRTICQNRCRTRRTLTHAVRDWESLQLDAEEIDEILQQKMRERHAGAHSGVNLALSSWTFLYKLKQMEFIIQLGFELETYQVDELNGMYWYLNYVSKSRLHHAERIKTIVFRQVDEHRKAKGSGNADEGAKDATEKQLQRSLAYTRLLLLDAAVTWEFSDALSCLYTVLSRLGLVRPPPRPFSDDRLRYEIRMKPFAPIGLPELPSFEEFVAGTTQPENSSVEILLYAERALAGVKKGLEMMSRMTPEDSFSVGSHERWTASAKKALKASIMATLAVSTLKKAMHKDGEDVKLRAEVPTPEKGLIYHEWWIVPKLIPTTE